MMRVKDIAPKTKIDPDREKIAEFLDMGYDDVKPHEAPGTYIVDLSNNLNGQNAYKIRNPFGNGKIPYTFDFSQEILVRWQEDKLQAM